MALGMGDAAFFFALQHYTLVKGNPTTRKSAPDFVQAPVCVELSTKLRTAARVRSLLCCVATFPRDPISRVRRTPAPPERPSMLPSPAPPPGRDGPPHDPGPETGHTPSRPARSDPAVRPGARRQQRARPLSGRRLRAPARGG